MSKPGIGAKIGFIAAALVIVGLAGFVAFGGSGTPEPDPAAAGSSLPRGEPAPDLDFQYLDGGSGSLAEFAGRPLVVNFFADWCPACVAEMPDFEEVHQEFDDVAFLGIDRSTSDAGALALLQQTGVTYQVALDRDGAIFQTFEGFSMPTTIFINAQGEVVDRQNGVIFRDDLRNRLETLFGAA